MSERTEHSTGAAPVGLLLCDNGRGEHHTAATSAVSLHGHVNSYSSVARKTAKPQPAQVRRASYHSPKASTASKPSACHAATNKATSHLARKRLVQFGVVQNLGVGVRELAGVAVFAQVSG